MQSQQSRIAKVAPTLKQMVLHHEQNTYPEGVEAFNAAMTSVLEEANLLEYETRRLEQIGTLPSNREYGMLVPIDVHDLLLKFAENGFNPDLWRCMAARVPEGEVGKHWQQKNSDLAADADDLLAPVIKDQIEVCTGRGSHSCAALRLAKFGGKSIHPELAGPDGQVSKTKFLALQPSWTKLLENGVGMKVIPGELEIEVPGLLSCLSRVGNASNDVFRQPTSIQMCSRIHALFCACSKSAAAEVDWAKIAKQASCGNGGVSALPMISQLCDFVRAWSGGQKAQLLKEIESYERTLTIKRKIFGSDLQALSTVDLLHAPKYVAVTRMHILSLLAKASIMLL